MLVAIAPCPFESRGASKQCLREKQFNLSSLSAIFTLMNETAKILRRGFLLEYVTLGPNVVGVAVVLYTALQPRTVALAASVLAGLALTALFGFWWADPLAGLLIVFYGFKEGRHA